VTPPPLLRALRTFVFLLPVLAPAAGCGHAAAVAPDPVAPVAAPTHVTWIEVEARELPRQLVVTGELRADAQIDLCSETEGRVLRADLERGQVVQQGEVLVELDARDAASRLAEAEAVQAQIEARLGITGAGAFDPEQIPDVRLARANMERAETEAGRYARLVADGAVARSLHDVERTNYEVAKERHAAEVDRMRESYRSLQAQQARVALARKALDDTQVRAPWSGSVMASHVDPGQFVRKGDRLATLVRVDTLRVNLAIPEAFVAAVQPHQVVQIEVRSRPGQAFTGTVTYVGPGLDPASRSLTAEAIVDNGAGQLQPGLFVTARIELPLTDPAVLVAKSAIATEAGVHHVMVLDGETAQKRFVQLGREIGSSVEVLRGLAAGEHVLAQGNDGVADGAHVVADAAGE
jgi:RND family efflux transporter MFP subunit